MQIESLRPTRIKTFFHWFIKWVSGFLFAFVVSSIGLSLLSYGTFSFVFVLIVAQGFFWKIFHSGNLLSVLIFDALFVFVLLALRLYVVVGPNL